MRTSEETLAALRDKQHYDITDLLQIMQVLRSENGCPWDKEQSHQSIRQDLLEECYEALEAIDMNSVPMMREELGDVLLQVVFHCQLEAEQQHFSFEDVCDEVCRKLVVRHPHVFGEITVENSEDVLRNWDAIKQETKQQTTAAETLESVCKALPALMYAQKLGKRAARAGMDWDSAEGALAYVRKEADELQQAMQSGSQADIEEELGDLLFSCVNTARHLHADAETALRGAADKFLRRFKETEQLVAADGKNMQGLSLEVLDTYWDQAKKNISGGTDQA